MDDERGVEGRDGAAEVGIDPDFLASPEGLALLAGNTVPDGSHPIAMGYAGWTAGQLESELSDNAWLSVDSSDELIFQTPIEDRWDAATRLLGIDPSALSTVAGHS